MPTIDSSFQSRAFGFNIFKLLIVIGLLALFLFFVYRGDKGIAILFGLLAVLIGLFNIGVKANAEWMTISALWLPLKTIQLADIKTIELLSDSPLSERMTLGIHIIDGSWSYHAGPATIRIITNDGKSNRLTVKNASKLLKLTKVKSAT